MSTRRSHRFTLGAALVALTALLGGLVAAPAAAAEIDAVLDISKSVSRSVNTPGQSFTYTITVDCSSADCINAQVVDVLPPEFDALTLTPNAAITGAPGTATFGGPNNRTLTVNFTRPLDAGGVGLASGDGPSIQVTFTVPAGLSPNWPSNGVAVTNTASITADNALTKTADAPVTINIPFVVATATGASWAPSTTQYKVGEASTLTVTTRNTSNALADSLELLVPVDPTAVSNLFDTVTFGGFGALTFPQGADRVQVDAYVNGAWVTGAPSTVAALPGSAAAADVTGLRIRFTSSTGTTLVANGTAGSLALDLIQRASTRAASTPLVTGANVTANVRGTVAVPGHGTASQAATATYAIGPLTSIVYANTSFVDAVIPAGTGSVAVLNGRNDSNGPLATLTLTQLPDTLLADTHLTFTALRDSGTAWPAGATSATVRWLVSSGTAPAPTTIASGDAWPATPALTGGQRIVGFEVEFAGAIPAGAAAAVPFRFEVASNTVPTASDIVTLSNTIQVDGGNDPGDPAPPQRSPPMQVIYPQIDVKLAKTVTPSAAVPPGGRSVTQLRANVGSQSGFVRPTSIVITDAASGSVDYWSAFDVVAIAPTQVPAGSQLQIWTTTVAAPTASDWTLFHTVSSPTVAQTYSAALPAGLLGVRFEFTNPDGFAQSTAVQGNLAFVARSTVRGTGNPVASDATPVSYPNVATVDAEGEVELPGGGPVTSTDGDDAAGPVIADPGNGGLLVDKRWREVNGSVTVSSQSGQQRTARLFWGAQITGHNSIVVTDPADPTAPVASTVFQNFDLVQIAPITTANDPYIAFDQVNDIRLYNGTTWTSVKGAACATAADCQGRFAGYTLTPAERASTVAVEITFTEWAAGRGTDPLAPPVGSGVASGPDQRPLDLVFQLRNRLRDATATPANPWITGARAYNATDAGLVRNDVRVTTGSYTATDSDTMLILDRPPGVGVTKGASAANLAIPVPGDTAASAYPTETFTVTARNTSDARAWYLRVTDQMPCTSSDIVTCANPTAGGVSGSTVNPYAGKTWDPATNPFNSFTITGVTLPNSATLTAAGVSSASVIVWNQNGTTATYSAAPTTAQLVNAVGVSVLFSGVSVDGGTIVSNAALAVGIQTRMREFLRSDPTTRTQPGVIQNHAFSQVWDGVLDDSTPNAYASASANVTLANAQLEVSTTKTFRNAANSANVTSILEANRGTDIGVRLTAASTSNATASPNQVVIDDTRAEFWNTFELRGVGAITRPSGADRARVVVRDAGGTWTPGAWSTTTTVALPSVALADVRGIRFEYSRADGAIFSAAAPAAAWNAAAFFTVRVRAADATTGAAIPFPSTVPNTVDTAVTNPTWGSATATANASMTLATGTFLASISKTPAIASSPAGETVNFTLVMRNTGTGYLDNPVVTDILPANATMPFGGSLLFDPTSEITYSTSTGGILPTTGQTVAYNDTTRRIQITWPAGNRLAPGETYTIVIPLQLAPGLRATDPAALNTFTFSSDRTLGADCGNATSNGRPVTTATPRTNCTTTAVVTTYQASAISSFKGVKGDVGTGTVSTRGATNVNNAATACVADGQGFYRQPCAANTVVGGTDLWKLQFVNGGNIDASTATIVDVLPTPGDRYLRSGLARGSNFTPAFAGGLQLATSGESVGTTIQWDVTTTPTPCANYDTDSTCTNTATWVDGSTFPAASYGSVTAVRVRFDFTAATGGVLKPGASVAVTYRTVNTPTTTAGDTRAPVAASVTPARAWNSFGVYARFTNNDERRVEPVRAGVQLATGSIQTTKVIAGVSAAYAPTSYSATASCTVAGVNVPLPASGAITLAAANATPYVARIDGIPVEAVCRIVEGATDAESVDYAPAAPTGTGAQVTVATAGTTTAAVPAAQRATITNTFDTTSLRIVKAVDTDATVGSFGPFDFTLTCASDTGTGVVPVTLDPADASFTLAAGGEKTVTGIPAPADCTLTETGSDHADGITVTTGSDVDTVVEGEAAHIELGSDAAYTTTVDNRYEAGTLAVRKVVTGGTSYGDAEFGFDVTCTYDGQTLLDTAITLEAGDTHTFTQVFPAGTSCSVVETDAGGATTAAADATVTIPAATGGATLGAVTAVMTNQFATGSVVIEKERDGAGAAEFGAGPFTAVLACTWERDGETLTIPLPDGGEVVLDASNGYTATVTGLIAGADCAITEPGSGAATSTDLGTVPTVSASSPVTVTLTNTFDLGELHIEKVREGEGVARWGAGPFEVEVVCGYDRDGTWVVIDLDDDATQLLTEANGYEATIGGLLVGAECVVTETDRGYAIASEVSTDDAPVVIPDTGAAEVTVTNTFLLGWLDIEKTASEEIVEGDTEFDYTLAVSNPGHVDAEGVQVTDELDADLRAEEIVAPGWTCDVTGEDTDGYGGTLTCDYDTVLAAGLDATDIVVTVSVRAEIEKDDIPNAAVVTSTTPQVDGGDDDITTPVKWLDLTASPQCLRDAPWLYYEIDARNVDLDGKTLTIDWKAADDTVVHSDVIELTPDLIDGDGIIHSRTLWPGAAVDDDGYGILWPGYRKALAGETTDFEELVYDETLPEAALREGASVTFSINPEVTVEAVYPPQTDTCPETLGPRDAGLWITKTADRGVIAAGDEFTYTIEGGNDGYGAATDVVLEDPIPSTLQVLGVSPAAAASETDPAWAGCTVTGRDLAGYGGLLHCELDRPLGVGEHTPNVELSVRLSPTAAAGTVINVASLSGIEVEGDPVRAATLPTLNVDDDAVVLSIGTLAATGAGWVLSGAAAALALLLGGAFILVLLALRRRRTA